MLALIHMVHVLPVGIPISKCKLCLYNILTIRHLLIICTVNRRQWCPNLNIAPCMHITATTMPCLTTTAVIITLVDSNLTIKEDHRRNRIIPHHTNNHTFRDKVFTMTILHHSQCMVVSQICLHSRIITMDTNSSQLCNRLIHQHKEEPGLSPHLILYKWWM